MWPQPQPQWVTDTGSGGEASRREQTGFHLSYDVYTCTQQCMGHSNASCVLLAVAAAVLGPLAPAAAFELDCCSWLLLCPTVVTHRPLERDSFAPALCHSLMQKHSERLPARAAHTHYSNYTVPVNKNMHPDPRGIHVNMSLVRPCISYKKTLANLGTASGTK